MSSGIPAEYVAVEATATAAGNSQWVSVENNEGTSTTAGSAVPVGAFLANENSNYFAGINSKSTLYMGSATTEITLSSVLSSAGASFRSPGINDYFGNPVGHSPILQPPGVLKINDTVLGGGIVAVATYIEDIITTANSGAIDIKRTRSIVNYSIRVEIAGLIIRTSQLSRRYYRPQ
jgi:hypothetical protein